MTAVPRGRPRRRQSAVPLVALAVLVAVALTTHRFLSLDNGRAILASTAFVGITAIGATLIMIAGSAVSLAMSQTATVAAMVFLATQDLGLPTAVLSGCCSASRHRRAGAGRRLLGRQPDRADHRGRFRDRRGGHLVQRRYAGLRRAKGTTSSTRPRWASRSPCTCFSSSRSWPSGSLRRRRPAGSCTWSARTGPRPGRPACRSAG